MAYGHGAVDRSTGSGPDPGKSKNLSKQPHIQPGPASHAQTFFLCLSIPEGIINVLSGSQALCQGTVSVHAKAVRLDKHRQSHVDEPVAYFASDAFSCYFPVSIVVGPWSVSFQWISVWVCIVHPEYHDEILSVHKSIPFPS